MLLQFDFGGGEALIIVPPFASTTMPSLAAHLLQACARRDGHDVRVLYANLLFAKEIGELNYEAVCRCPVQYLLGERLLCSAAFGLPSLGRDRFLERLRDAHVRVDNNNIRRDLQVSDLSEWEHDMHVCVDNISRAVAQQRFKVVGCTTTFEQTNASIALLNRIKNLSPETVTALGGANCAGEMAEGILMLSDRVDYIFCGESETTFPRFLAGIAADDYPNSRIVRGESCRSLDELPVPDYTEFFQQRQDCLGRTGAEVNQDLWIPYETSRGCWWGQKHRCAFCGLNGQLLHFRSKSVERLVPEIQRLVSTSPTKRVCMTDNILPREYFRTFLPLAPESLPGVTFFYEVKANLSLEDVMTMHRAGVKLAQPGIESLSNACLKLMNKGVSARQNINLLRYARAVGMWLGWNILYALPGDKVEDYREMLRLIPLLHHLQPPLGLSHLSLERFSPYFENKVRFGIKNLRPLSVYDAIFPEDADVLKIAYHFEADYESGSKEAPKLIEQFESEINHWRHLWEPNEELPCLGISNLNDECYLLLDTRGVPGTQELNLITAAQARLALTGVVDSSEDLQWGLERKVLVQLDSRTVPLATAEPNLFRRFDGENIRLDGVRGRVNPQCWAA